MHVANVLQIFRHWRKREEDGDTALIWNPSCDILMSTHRPLEVSKKGKEREQFHSSTSSSEENYQFRSDEENFAHEMRAIPEEEDEDLDDDMISPTSPLRTSHVHSLRHRSGDCEQTHYIFYLPMPDM